MSVTEFQSKPGKMYLKAQAWYGLPLEEFSLRRAGCNLLPNSKVPVALKVGFGRSLKEALFGIISYKSWGLPFSLPPHPVSEGHLSVGGEV